ncbi:MAG: hypothetical protein EPO03_10225, partial [Porticoccaceae bacterium]
MSRAMLRPWRDASFRLLAAALAIAAFALGAMILLRAELEARFAVRTAEALGGELVLSGTHESTPEQRALAAQVRHTEVVDFSTVLVRGDDLLLVSARAVDAAYPLATQSSPGAGPCVRAVAGAKRVGATS